MRLISLITIILICGCQSTKPQERPLQKMFNGKVCYRTEFGTSVEHPISREQAIPIVRIEPYYPKSAKDDGIEGYVNLSFVVDQLGKITNINIIDSKPSKIFDESAIAAVRSWKYKPKCQDGKALDDEVIVGLTFEL